MVANCTQTSTKLGSRADPKYGVSASPRVVEPGQPVPKGGGTYRVGKPYVIAGRTYYPAENKRYRREGVASWYGDDFHGRLTANGEIYDMGGISAAHPTLPMPSYARVTNMRNGKSLIVRVNDRGPFHAQREIDLSAKAAEALEFRGKGLSRVKVEYVGPASLDGSDDRRLMATLRERSPAPAPSRTMVADFRPTAAQREARRAIAIPRQAPQEEPIAVAQNTRATEEITFAQDDRFGARVIAQAPPLPAQRSVAAPVHMSAPAAERIDPRDAEEEAVPQVRDTRRVVAQALPPPVSVYERPAEAARPMPRAVSSPMGPAVRSAALGSTRTAPHETSRREIQDSDAPPPAHQGTRVIASALPPPTEVSGMARPFDPAPAMQPAGRPGAPRLVWQTGPAPVRVGSPVTAYAPVEDRVPVATGRGLY